MKTETVNGVEICETRFSHPDFQIGTDMRFASIWIRVPGGDWVRTPYRQFGIVAEQCRTIGREWVETMRAMSVKIGLMSAGGAK